MTHNWQKIHGATEISDFTIRTEILLNQDGVGYWVNFQCFEVVASEPSRDYWCYEPIGSTGSRDGFTYDLDKARIFLQGFVKWDGCSEMTFMDEHDGQIHFCGRQAALRVGALLNRVYEIAADLMAQDVRDLE